MIAIESLPVEEIFRFLNSVESLYFVRALERGKLQEISNEVIRKYHLNVVTEKSNAVSRDRDCFKNKISLCLPISNFQTGIVPVPATLPFLRELHVTSVSLRDIRNGTQDEAEIVWLFQDAVNTLKDLRIGGTGVCVVPPSGNGVDPYGNSRSRSPNDGKPEELLRLKIIGGGNSASPAFNSRRISRTSDASHGWDRSSTQGRPSSREVLTEVPHRAFHGAFHAAQQSRSRDIQADANTLLPIMTEICSYFERSFEKLSRALVSPQPQMESSEPMLTTKAGSWPALRDGLQQGSSSHQGCSPSGGVSLNFPQDMESFSDSEYGDDELFTPTTGYMLSRLSYELADDVLEHGLNHVTDDRHHGANAITSHHGTKAIACSNPELDTSDHVNSATVDNMIDNTLVKSGMETALMHSTSATHEWCDRVSHGANIYALHNSAVTAMASDSSMNHQTEKSGVDNSTKSKADPFGRTDSVTTASTNDEDRTAHAKFCLREIGFQAEDEIEEATTNHMRCYLPRVALDQRLAVEKTVERLFCGSGIEFVHQPSGSNSKEANGSSSKDAADFEMTVIKTGSFEDAGETLRLPVDSPLRRSKERPIAGIAIPPSLLRHFSPQNVMQRLHLSVITTESLDGISKLCFPVLEQLEAHFELSSADGTLNFSSLFYIPRIHVLKLVGSSKQKLMRDFPQIDGIHETLLNRDACSKSFQVMRLKRFNLVPGEAQPVFEQLARNMAINNSGTDSSFQNDKSYHVMLVDSAVETDMGRLNNNDTMMQSSDHESHEPFYGYGAAENCAATNVNGASSTAHIGSQQRRIPHDDSRNCYFSFTCFPQLPISVPELIRLRIMLGLPAFGAHSHGISAASFWPKRWPQIRKFWKKAKEKSYLQHRGLQQQQQAMHQQQAQHQALQQHQQQAGFGSPASTFGTPNTTYATPNLTPNLPFATPNPTFATPNLPFETPNLPNLNCSMFGLPNSRSSPGAVPAVAPTIGCPTSGGLGPALGPASPLPTTSSPNFSFRKEHYSGKERTLEGFSVFDSDFAFTDFDSSARSNWELLSVEDKAFFENVADIMSNWIEEEERSGLI